MENIYTVYTKVIDGVTFYFVKKFKTFPEYNDVPAILESYGMHSSFEKACAIAMVNDKGIREQLLSDLEQNSSSAKLVQMNGGKVVVPFNQDNELNDAQAI